MSNTFLTSAKAQHQAGVQDAATASPAKKVLSGGVQSPQVKHLESGSACHWHLCWVWGKSPSHDVWLMSICTMLLVVV